ncbi:MAG: hypothetical protein PVI78_01360, partial [Anaerolineales bacterium]
MSTDTILLVSAGLGVVLLIAGVLSAVLGRRSVVDERLGRYSESGGAAVLQEETDLETGERINPIREF